MKLRKNKLIPVLLLLCAMVMPNGGPDTSQMPITINSLSSNI